MHSSKILPIEVQQDVLTSARQFIGWLKESQDVLALQIATSESLTEGLTSLNMERCIQDLEGQKHFIIATQAWHDHCSAYWSRLGYQKTSVESGLAEWLDHQQSSWEKYPDMKGLLGAWSMFRSSLARIQELNTLNQVLVEQLTEDNRRKLQALMEYAGIGNTVYTAEGDTELRASNTAASSSLTGGGRLLAKG